MRKAHKIAQKIVFLGIVFLCLQYTIVFDSPAKVDESFKVVVEFKHLYQDGSATTYLHQGSLPDGYRSVYRESEVYAFESKEYLISDRSIIRGLRTDIERTFVAGGLDRWTLHIVFKKEFTDKLLNVSQHSNGRTIAVVINSDLLATPISEDFQAKLNDQGEYELVVRTNVKHKKEAEEILDRYNM